MVVSEVVVAAAVESMDEELNRDREPNTVGPGVKEQPISGDDVVGGPCPFG